MSEQGSEFTTTVGRIVWGHPAKPRDKMKDGQVVRDVASGAPVKQTSFGVAFPKAEFEQYIRPWFVYEAGTMYPNGVPGGFAYKITDGDSNECARGSTVPFNQREGYPGHFVVAFSTELAGFPQCFVLRNGAYFQIGESDIKCGDYVRVKANARAHGGQSPGLYINPQMVELVGVGTAIVSAGGAGDPMAAFGGQAPALPPGASAPGAVPVAGQPPAAPAPGYAPQPAAAPVAAPAYAPPAQMPPPATDFIPGAPQQPAYAPPAAPAAAPGMPGQPMPGQAMPGQAPYPGMPAPR